MPLTVKDLVGSRPCNVGVQQVGPLRLELKRIPKRPGAEDGGMRERACGTWGWWTRWRSSWRSTGGRGGRWLLLGTHAGSVEVRAEPFEALALELEALWRR